MSSHYATLDGEALLHISGPDTLTFLQGQTTCDTSQVDASHALPGAYCTPQGRVVCDFLLSRLGEEHYALRLRRDIRHHSATVFGKYIVFSKADLAADREDWLVLGCWGEQVAEALHRIFGDLPGEQYAASSGEGFVLVQLDQAGEQFECYIDCAAAARQLESLTSTLSEGTEARWQALQIAAGIGRIEAATVEEFIPQMLNYDLTGHINFNKGCYTGQEVVARLHYRGTPKRRLYLARWDGHETVAAGTPLYRTGSDQSVGNLVNSAANDNGTQGLVISTAEGIETGLHLGAADGPLLVTDAAPYS